MPTTIHGTNGITFNDGSTQNTRPAVGFRNRIINGDMRIDQRNAGASVAFANGQYLLDRWLGYQTATTGKITAIQSTTAPSGFSNSMLFTSQSSYSVLTTDVYGFAQKIEAFNTSDLGFGTAAASAVTLSFQVYSSLTGTFGGALQNSSQGYSYPFTYSISTANTWTKINVTIAGPTAGTWISGTNGIGLTVIFGLGVGSTFSGTAGAWSANSYYSATGAVSVVGTNGATFYITGVQLEAGSTATEFERRPYGTELALCQRYYEVGGGASNSIWSGYCVNGSSYYYGTRFIVTKRVTPTVYNITNIAALSFPSTASVVGGLTFDGFQLSRTANATSNSGYFLDSWNASSEL